MKNIMLGILLCLLWVRGMANQGNEVFLDDPSDITVFEGDEAVFSCVTTDELIIWRVNGTDINDLPSETQDKLVADSNTAATALDFFTLTIPGSVEFNGTRVQCVTTHGSIESMSATLYIQGSLSSVMDVNVSSDGTSVTIAWTAPFSLDVTNVDPDIWYSVLIYNVTDEPTTIPCTNYINITETNYTFTPDYPTPCHKYVFTVIPVNGAGQGDSLSVTGYIVAALLPNITVAEHVIAAISSYYLRVTFHVSGDVDSVCSYSLPGVDQDSIQQISKVQDEVVIIYVLSANQYFNTPFRVSDSVRSWNNIKNISFTTFDIQDFTTKTTENEIVVTGQFVKNSLAKGLFIVLRSDNGSPDEVKALLRDGQKASLSTSITVPPSAYSLLVYDLEDNGLPGLYPAITLEHQLRVTNGTIIHIPSMVLKYAEISENGAIQVLCEFTDDYPDSSCVVVYREHNSTVLTVIDYPHTTIFPVSVTVGKYPTSLSVFGKDRENNMDKKPFTAKLIKATSVMPTTPMSSVFTDSPSLSMNDFSKSLFSKGVGVGVAVGVVTSFIVVIVAVLIIKLRQIRGQKKVLLTKNVAYEIHTLTVSSTGRT